MNLWHESARCFFLCGMRFYFGVWLLYVGLSKWLIIGSGTFVGFVTAQFDKSWSPHPLNVFLGWVILLAEPILAVLVLSGIKARQVWTLVTLFLFMLTMGQTILMKPEVIMNWEYLVLALVTAALSEPSAPPRER